MEGPNYIAAMVANIDSLGKDFTAATYGVFSYYLTPVMAGLFTLYIIFWGFRFWQGHGDTVVTMVFKLVRIAVIFSLVAAWGPFQIALYRSLTGAPYMVSSVMLNHIVNPRTGKAMGIATLAADLNSIYVYALTASAKIERASSASDVPSTGLGADGEPKPPDTKPVVKISAEKALAETMSASIQAAIIWIAAALFVGYAVALLLFAKIALWVLLALAPFFIMLLMFQIPSRFFSGWLTGTIQVILIPVFLSTFLSFYNLVIQDVVKALALSIAKDGIPAMKEAGPFVLVCLAGLFLLTQIVPLTARIATSSQEWLTNAVGHAGGMTKNMVNTIVGGRDGASSGKPSLASASPAQLGPTHAMETSLREVQDRNAAVNRQSRNR